jgi:peptidoglycan/xylan/chitin deacetylase (PgdA/CDA1 family)
LDRRLRRGRERDPEISRTNSSCSSVARASHRAVRRLGHETANAIVDAGHKIQNHSWSHINLQTAPESSVREQVSKTQEIIREATGVTPTKLRPPYGAGGWARRFDPEILKVAREFSLTIENWDLDTEDWKAPQGIGAPKVALVREEMAKKSAHRLVVLMHVQPATARDLPQFIETLKGWGFAFGRP